MTTEEILTRLRELLAMEDGSCTNRIGIVNGLRQLVEDANGHR
jgi:hypothetical protein